MKVHLIKKQTIEEFATENARSKSSFEKWLGAIKYADWDQPSDIKKTFSSADLLGGGSNRVVFDIGGNTYRMIGKYLFGNKNAHLFICWIGTHAEYDKLCNEKKQYEISVY